MYTLSKQNIFNYMCNSYPVHKTNNVAVNKMYMLYFKT